MSSRSSQSGHGGTSNKSTDTELQMDVVTEQQRGSLGRGSGDACLRRRLSGRHPKDKEGALVLSTAPAGERRSKGPGVLSGVAGGLCPMGNGAWEGRAESESGTECARLCAERLGHGCRCIPQPWIGGRQGGSLPWREGSTNLINCSK